MTTPRTTILIADLAADCFKDAPRNAPRNESRVCLREWRQRPSRIARSRPAEEAGLEMRSKRFLMLPIPTKALCGAPLITDCETVHAPSSSEPFSDYCRC